MSQIGFVEGWFPYHGSEQLECFRQAAGWGAQAQPGVSPCGFPEHRSSLQFQPFHDVRQGDGGLVAGVQDNCGHTLHFPWLGFQRAGKHQFHGCEGLTWKVDERKFQSRVEGGTKQLRKMPRTWLYYGGTNHDAPFGR